VTEIWRNARLATMNGGEPYGLIDDGAIAVRGGAIAWVGESTALPADYARDAVVHDCAGRCITPGLIDCHTHVVYAGDRSREFTARLSGSSYAEIARAGGGILATVRATRAASDADLRAQTDARVRDLCACGVTTLEAKSGYGLDRQTELRTLRLARELESRHRLRIRTTYLGLHALEPQWKSAGEYVTYVCDEVLPAVVAERLADAVDAFCEPIAFSPEECERYFERARGLGLPAKIHADQLSRSGGTELGARLRMLSVDHLECAANDDYEALAGTGVVAVLLPGAYYYLRRSKPPSVANLRRLQIPFAVATDCNPGTSPIVSPLLAMNLACTLFGLTPEEALRGFTLNAARALGLAGTLGTLAPGRKADFVIWETEHPDSLAATIGINPGATVIFACRPRAANA
jgi:imidazolonepropionase